MAADLALALGTSETTLLEITAAYAAIPGGGQGVWPFGITAIRDATGRVLWQRVGSGPGQVLAPEALAIMNHMMTEVIARGTGTAAAFGYPAGGKTGTSSDFRDAWFMGFTADFVTGVWVGNDSGAGMKKVTGGGLPAHVWRDVMMAAHVGRMPRDLPGTAVEAPPEDLISRFWQALTGN